MENEEKEKLILEKFEDLFSLKGNFRVLYTFYKHDKPLRLYEIHRMTSIPYATLDRILNFLILKNILKKEREYYEYPRREIVGTFKLTPLGKEICKTFFENKIIDILKEEHLRKKIEELSNII